MTIEVNLNRVIDFGDLKVLDVLKIDAHDLAVAWRKVQNIDSTEAITQKIGRAIYSNGCFEAIKYPSARIDGQYNLAVFPDRLMKDSKIVIYDPDKIIERAIYGK
jgi:hypothetical protein